MADENPSESGRRRGRGSKGDHRERQILDVAERLLAEMGFEAMTVEMIATGAGISRASLYFYFGSKQDVLTALVDRTLTAIDPGGASSRLDHSRPVEQLISAGLAGIEAAWREHGHVMRAAVEFAATVPAVRRRWTDTLETNALVYSSLFRGQPTDGPTGSHALSRSMSLMTERSYYWSFAESGTERLAEVTATCHRLWTDVVSQSASD